MKKTLLLVLLSAIVVFAVANGRPAEVPIKPKCECICPTLDTLIKEKEAADKEAQQELGRLRRQVLKDKLSPFFNP